VDIDKRERDAKILTGGFVCMVALGFVVFIATVLLVPLLFWLAN